MIVDGSQGTRYAYISGYTNSGAAVTGYTNKGGVDALLIKMLISNGTVVKVIQHGGSLTDVGGIYRSTGGPTLFQAFAMSTKY